MRLIKRNIVIFATALLVACGGIDKLVLSMRAAVAFSTPLISRLVAQGKLSQAKAEFIRQDFGDVTIALGVLGTDLDAAAGNKLQQVAAAQKFSASVTAIYARGHYGADPQILEAANLVNDIAASIVAFFGGAPPSATSDGQQRKPTKGEIDAKIKALEGVLRR